MSCARFGRAGQAASCSATSRLAKATIVKTGGMPHGSGMTLESHT